jgi:multiple sugar transport system permease protein
MAGYALARYQLKVTKLLIAFAALTVIVPIQTYLVPLFFQFKYFDFFGIGSLTGLFIGSPLSVNLTNSEMTHYLTAFLGSGLRSGLFILLFAQFFKGMPKELESAARVDGCGEAKTFINIMIPNASPVFLVVCIMSLVWYWNDYFFPSIMLRQNPLLATKIGMLRTLVNMNSTTASYGDGLTETVVIYAGAILFILPLLIIYMFAQKYFIQSVERTGITG